MLDCDSWVGHLRTSEGLGKLARLLVHVRVRQEEAGTRCGEGRATRMGQGAKQLHAGNGFQRGVA